jgi:hypothetical protein
LKNALLPSADALRTRVSSQFLVSLSEDGNDSFRGIPCDSDGARRLCEAAWGMAARKKRSAKSQGSAELRTRVSSQFLVSLSEDGNDSFRSLCATNSAATRLYSAAKASPVTVMELEGSVKQPGVWRPGKSAVPNRPMR